jgi:plastocyanin
MGTRRTIIAAALLAAAACVAGCGSSSSGSGSAASSPSPATSPSAATSPTPTSSGGTALSGTRAVAIQNFAFTPKIMTVARGTTITWTNKDSTAHTVTSTSNVFDSGHLNPGKTFSFTFAKAGTYAYMCTIHPFMTATVIVQ